MPSDSLLGLLRALHVKPDPEFIKDVEYLSAVAEDIYELVPEQYTWLGLRSDGRKAQAVFFDPTFEGHGQCDKIGRAVFKGAPLPSPLHGTYRVEIKRLMNPVTLCMVKVYEKDKSKHQAVWKGTGEGNELIGNWSVDF